MVFILPDVFSDIRQLLRNSVGSGRYILAEHLDRKSAGVLSKSNGLGFFVSLKS